MANDWKRWQDEAIAYGWQIIRAAPDGEERYELCAGSDGPGTIKKLYIYDKQTCDTVVVLHGPTWYDLFVAARDAWNIHVFIARTF